MHHLTVKLCIFWYMSRLYFWHLCAFPLLFVFLWTDYWDMSTFGVFSRTDCVSDQIISCSSIVSDNTLMKKTYMYIYKRSSLSMLNQLKHILCQVIWAAVDACASTLLMRCSVESHLIVCVCVCVYSHTYICVCACVYLRGELRGHHLSGEFARTHWVVIKWGPHAGLTQGVALSHTCRHTHTHSKFLTAYVM